MKKNLFVFLVLICSTAVFAVDNSQMLSDQKARYTAIFNNSDKNQDRVLSTEEAGFAGLSKGRFVSLDVDRDGSIALDEFLSMAATEESKGSEGADG